MNHCCPVFVSYAAEDRATADAIGNGLTAVGVDCWIAHHSLIAGQIFPGKIARAIQNADVLVVIHSKHANLSVWVPTEVNEAFRLSKHIIAVKLDDESFADDLLVLQSRHCVGNDPNRALQIQSVVEHVRRFLEMPPPPRPPQPPPRVSVVVIVVLVANVFFAALLFGLTRARFDTWRLTGAIWAAVLIVCAIGAATKPRVRTNLWTPHPLALGGMTVTCVVTMVLAWLQWALFPPIVVLVAAGPYGNYDQGYLLHLSIDGKAVDPRPFTNPMAVGCSGRHRIPDDVRQALIDQGAPWTSSKLRDAACLEIGLSAGARVAASLWKERERATSDVSRDEGLPFIYIRTR